MPSIQCAMGRPKPAATGGGGIDFCAVERQDIGRVPDRIFFAMKVLPAICNFRGGAGRARKKNSDRWNNVFAGRPENMGFWHGHCSATVPPNARGAVPRWVSRTLLRLRVGRAG